MKAYVGIDVGTTNTKVGVVTKKGLENVYKFQTFKKKIDGVELFDMDRIEMAVRKTLKTIRESYRIVGIACTSVGESVVPVASNEKLHDPIVWYDTCTKPLYEEYHHLVNRLAPYSVSGSRDIYYYSLYKILYMQRNGIVELDKVERWLPVSSYIAYKLTGNAVWDMTQAYRSHMVDIHRRCWNEELLKAFNIPIDQLGRLDYTSSFVGYHDDTPVFLAGHDHLTGTYGLISLFGSELIFDSMGTASYTVGVATEKDNEFHMESPFMKTGGNVGIAFQDRQYYLASGMRFYGKLIEMTLKLFGFEVSSKRFERLNDSISQIPTDPVFYIFTNGDNIVGEDVDGINFVQIPPDCSQGQTLQSVYLYLCYASRITVETLRRLLGDLPIVLGGALVENKVFMKYKASMLGEPLYCLSTTELTTLGAAIAAITGAEDEETLQSLREKITFQRIEPHPQDVLRMNELYERMNEQYQKILQRRGGQ
ncbi:MAG: FGGY family carbohydrate kinase [Pseudothermotoga sp.]|uniref:FGGY-family carbohydrate kinase n=1 Tax=Pseudothermotoga sp. TaxID=2033661 RepID=UPI00258754DF|nr:FGGY family carbohydrate kinase [Pseudothermotoga sp.]MDI6862573.1 FGGY family carbohydrate kinase [Pseudothermotoga sp.]